MSSELDLSGPSVVNVQWLDTEAVNPTLVLSKTFRSYSTDTRYLIWVDGFSECPEGATTMTITLNGELLVPVRKLKTPAGGTTSLSMNTVGVCTQAQTIVDQTQETHYENTIQLSFEWTGDSTTQAVPSVSSICVSMLPISSEITNAPESTPPPETDPLPILL